MITKRKDSYLARIYYTENDKRKSISKSFPQIKLARAWQAEMEVAKATTGVQSVTDITFTDYFWQWFETYRKAKVAPATVARYKTTYNTLVLYLKDIQLTKMTRMRYQQFINEYGAEHAKQSVSKINTAVRAAILDAIEDGLIDKDFTNRITLSGGDSMDVENKYLNMKDTEKLINDLSDKVDIYTTSFPMIYTALMTGARLAEVQGLTEKDFFPEFRRIQINKTYNHTHTDPKNPFKPTKNKSSNRIVDIPGVLVNYLNTLIETQHKFNHVNNPHKLLFMNTRGDVPSSNGINKVLANELRRIKAGKIITFHGLRHTHASYLLAKGSKIEYVSKRLGHSSIETTMKVYAHMMRETEQDEIQKAVKSLETITKVKKDQSLDSLGHK